MRLAAYIVQQVWPNLAADVVWVPLVWAWHHTHFRRTLQREIDLLHQRLEKREN